jgi:hypothetical protein
MYHLCELKIMLRTPGLAPVMKMDTVRIKTDTGVSRSGYYEIAENLSDPSLSLP